MATLDNNSRNIAVYVDLENVAIGVRDAKLATFDINLILKRLVDKGNIIVKKGYANWGKFESYRRPLHEAGVELLDMPGSTLTGKNSADIKMVVDALELSYTKPHIDTFALVSGDSDFTPLVSKLRENDKRTIGVGVKNSTSRILIDACDEFIYYDDLVRKSPKRKRAKSTSKLPKKTREGFDLLLDSARALQRENRELHSSRLKDTMKRKQPQFNEEYHGYSTFGQLLKDAEKHKLIKLRKDAKSGTWVIDELLEEQA